VNPLNVRMPFNTPGGLTHDTIFDETRDGHAICHGDGMHRIAYDGMIPDIG